MNQGANMLKRDEFVNFILDGHHKKTSTKKDADSGPSLPGVFDEFGFSQEEASKTEKSESSFARQLIEASGFGNAEYLDRTSVILGDDPAAKYLPENVFYWGKSKDRPYQTLLFELNTPGLELLNGTLFRNERPQRLLEDALHRLIQNTLTGFQKGGDKRTASVKQGKQRETICIISVRDDRDENENAFSLVCLGTRSAAFDSLETFYIRETARNWERPLAEEHLGRLYDRHFKKIIGAKWQDAFITGAERQLARKLLNTCIEPKPKVEKIEKDTVNLLEEIAGSFGLRRKGGKKGRRLTAYDLPKDHDIGMNPEEVEKKGGKNPFGGMTLRDEGNHLLGYIIYCLDEVKDADTLRNFLESYNRFHNVLVIYPDGDYATLELWQGNKKLEGRLTKRGANFEGEGKVVNLLTRFFVVSKADIKNPDELAEELAYRARYLRRLALKQLNEEASSGGDLFNLYKMSKKALIDDQTHDEFADAYAQTLTYGLLSARWISINDFLENKLRFTRERALKYFPPSSPFLKEFFSAVLKASFEYKLTWLLEDIADLLDRTDIRYVFRNGDGDDTISSDPVIHFYEPFLASYDAELKKYRGVYYTPDAVVSFIVRSVDLLLRSEFGLDLGLADTSTWGDLINKGTIKRPEALPKSCKSWQDFLQKPFVQILDPAAGTGTFLKHSIDLIHETMTNKWASEGKAQAGRQKAWNTYVRDHLLPRIIGFELMMAPYTVCHMKIALALANTGYKIKSKQRINIFLTNSMEKPHHYSGSVGNLDFVGKESIAANIIKLNSPISVVIGNPPYSGHSANKNEWITKLLREKLKDGADTLLSKNEFRMSHIMSCKTSH